MIQAYWNGFRVLEIRDYYKDGAYIAVSSTMHSRLMWVSLDRIEIRETGEK